MQDVSQDGVNVSPAKNVKHRLGKNWFHENLQSPAANEAGIVTGFMVQIKRHLAGLLALNYLFSRGPYVSFHAAAAHGTKDRAIVADQHARSFVARDRTVRVDDGRERSPLSDLANPHNFFENVHQ